MTTLMRAGSVLASGFPFVVVVVLIATMWRHSGALFVLLICLAASMIYRRRTTNDMLFLIVPALMGYVAELVATGAGAWAYPNGSEGYVPPWVAVAWGCGALSVKRCIYAMTSEPQGLRKQRSRLARIVRRSRIRRTPAVGDRFYTRPRFSAS